MSGIVKNLEAAAKTMNLEKVLLLLSGITKLGEPALLEVLLTALPIMCRVQMTQVMEQFEKQVEDLGRDMSSRCLWLSRL
jgi:hypothetical protein